MNARESVKLGAHDVCTVRTVPLNARASNMAASHLETMKVENEQAVHRIAWLESNLHSQAQRIAAAEERKAELSALRSSALLRFAKQHAEEEAARRELSDCRKGIEAAWKRIQELQEAITRVCLERQQQEAVDAAHQLRYAEHTKTVKRTERCALVGAEILERECGTLIECLTAADARHAAVQEQAGQEQAEHEGEQEQDVDECNNREVQVMAEAVTDEASADYAGKRCASAAPMTDEELENAVMCILASSGPSDAASILADARCAGADAQRLDRTLCALKDAYLCYEAGEGCFAII